GTAPQIVMVDYLDLVRPMENHRDYRLNIAQAYREFRAFLKSMQVFGVSPTQLNKTAHDLETPDMQHLAECFDKAAIADFLVLLGQTKRQRQEQRMGLFFAKNRAGKRDMMVDMAVDYDRNRFDAYGEPRFVLEEGLNEVTARATVHQTGGVIPVPTAYASALQNANPPSAVYDPTAVPPSAVL
ncbi:MAG: DnaB-like helicase C-terminal domain-containing protein, partial [Dehalococcoidales bacterium]